MKKYFVLLAAMLLCLRAYSQEAEAGDYLSLTVPVRGEGSYLTKDNSISFESSSVYTLFEGAKSDFSWTVATHWFQGGPNSDFLSTTKDLYNYAAYSETTNFLDYFLLNYTCGNFTFSLGKDMLRTGAVEFDEWDWEISQTTTSMLWDNLASYQWGGSVTWNFLENNDITLQYSASPLSARPWEGFGLTGQYRYESDRLLVLAGASFFESYHGGSDDGLIVSAGARYAFTDSFSLGLDLNAVGGTYFYDAEGFGCKLTADYSFSDRLAVNGALVYGVNPWMEGGSSEQYCYGGLGLHWQPFAEADNFRIFCNAFSDKYEGGFGLALGLRYDLCLVK